jgi:ornithine cyclodeaminase
MTSSTAPLFAAEDVKPGVHVVLIGSYKPHMREVEDALLSRVGAVLVDSREACAHEAGELQNIDPAQLVELGELVNGDSEALDRAKSGEVTLFKSVGLGVQDVAIAGLVLDEAEKMGLGTEVPGYD